MEWRWDTTKASPVSSTATATTANSIKTSWTWSQGNLTSQTDPNGNVTSYSGMKCGNSLPGTIVHPAVGTETREYNCHSGLLVSRTTPASLVIQYGYDRYGRPTLQREGNTRKRTWLYNDSGRYVIGHADVALFGDQRQSWIARYDQLGRVVREQQAENNESDATLAGNWSVGLIRETAYQLSVGVNATVTSGPYRQGDSVGWRVEQRDQAGRLCQTLYVTGAQPAALAHCGAYPGAARATVSHGAMVGSGRWEKHTDEAGKAATRYFDARGRLQSVIEAPDEAGYLYATGYTYSALDQLTQVMQGAQSRTFHYTSLNRLQNATQPESGTTQYEYDNAGNLTKRTDAKGQVVCYGTMSGSTCTPNGYDGANRPVRKSYLNGVLNAVTWTYSGERLTAVDNGTSRTDYTQFDELGRVMAQTQTTGGVAYALLYLYQPWGLSQMMYPSGRVVSYTADHAGRVSAVTGSGGRNYSTGMRYWAGGAVKQRTYGNGAVEAQTVNSRQQIDGMTVTKSGTKLLGLSYSYGSTDNNGNVKTQTVTANGQSRLMSYDYDAVNRLKTAVESNGWTQIYKYDRYGNRAVLAGSTIPNASDTPTTPDETVPFSAGNNHWQSQTYDENGNLQSQYPLSRTVTYDAENRPAQVMTAQGTVSYLYDGDGRRVRRTKGAETTHWVYDASGNLAAEYSTTASPMACQPCYVTADPLGSTRLLTKADGTVLRRVDYYPFGEEVGSGINGRGAEYGDGALLTATPLEPRQKFTGKERDAETGLDYFGARYMSSAQGRFTSPDPFNILMEAEDRDEFNAYISNPQNWNRYVYTWNNPLRYVDPDGERVYVVAYTTGNAEGDEEFKKVAETLARQIQNSKGFDAKKDTVVVRGGGSKDDFKSLLADANKLEKQFGKVEGVSLVSHGGPADGPIFTRADASGTRQFMGGERELIGLTVNWAQSGEARFYGCNTAVAFCQRFANAQGVPAWGFNTYSSFTGDPNSKSKWYLLNPWIRDLYMIGRDGSGMVRRNPTRPRR